MHTPPRILVVDDTPENLEIMTMRLQRHGYDIVTAVDGEDALDKVRAMQPDLVLLDIMMPKLDGIALTKRLKADTSLPFIPIVLLTAKADANDVVAGLDAGGDDYLTKPVDHGPLVARVRSIFRRQGLAVGEASTEAAADVFQTPGEIALARKLVKFADAIRLAPSNPSGWSGRSARPIFSVTRSRSSTGSPPSRRKKRRWPSGAP